MATDSIYDPKYKNSWAIVIGINSYTHAPPLGYARQDAEAVAKVAVEQLGFPLANVKLLLDSDATRGAITSEFLRLASDSTGRDDRVLVFFAGHGLTKKGRRGEVGYLVPVDGQPSDLSTLIRWDELTRNSDLIAAKHILFVMDACYGGTAITRALAPGSQRFLKDMLQRYSRQVLTAGKADEVVADSGGPRVGHSIFTGHFLDALEGKAATGDGVISANAVMAYVYHNVSKDINSHQSPHYGFLDGDGDFIFRAPNLDALEKSKETDEDVLIQVPAGHVLNNDHKEPLFVERLKTYLSDPKEKIRLDDTAGLVIRDILGKLSETEFPSETSDVTVADFVARLRRYETLTTDIRALITLVARWGQSEHREILAKTVRRLTDAIEPRGGKVAWLASRWFPARLLLYSGGIASVSSKNYENLRALLTTPLSEKVANGRSREAVLLIEDGISEIYQTGLYNKVPGHEKQYVPDSEYLFKVVQPQLEDLLFLGSDYESCFDRFEILRTLVYVDLSPRGEGWTWGPAGRFCWKQRRSSGHSPFDLLVAEADSENKTWGPISAGLFGGSIERFKSAVGKYRGYMRELPWR